MNCKVVNALLSLLYKSISENLPSQIFRYTFNLLERLIDRHSSNRNWWVTNNPLPRLMNVFSSWEVHDCVSTPAHSPNHFSNLLVYRRAESWVTNISINLNQEVPSNNHWLCFRVINIVWNDCTAPSNLISDKFWCNNFRSGCAKTLALVLTDLVLVFLPETVLSNRNVFHFRSDDALSCIMHLSHIFSFFCFSRRSQMLEPEFVQLFIVEPFIREIWAYTIQYFSISPLFYPVTSNRVNSFSVAYWFIRVSVRAGSIVHVDWVIFLSKVTYRIGELYSPHWNQNILPRTCRIDFCWVRKRLYKCLVNAW